MENLSSKLCRSISYAKETSLGITRNPDFPKLINTREGYLTLLALINRTLNLKYTKD